MAYRYGEAPKSHSDDDGYELDVLRVHESPAPPPPNEIVSMRGVDSRGHARTPTDASVDFDRIASRPSESGASNKNFIVEHRSGVGGNQAHLTPPPRSKNDEAGRPMTPASQAAEAPIFESLEQDGFLAKMMTGLESPWLLAVIIILLAVDIVISFEVERTDGVGVASLVLACIFMVELGITLLVAPRFVVTNPLRLLDMMVVLFGFTFEVLRMSSVLTEQVGAFETLLIINKVGKAFRVKTRLALWRLVHDEHASAEQPQDYFEERMTRAYPGLSLDKIRLLPRLAALILDSLLIPMLFWLLTPDSYDAGPNDEYLHGGWIATSFASLVMSSTVVYFFFSNKLSTNRLMSVIATSCMVDVAFRLYTIALSGIALAEPAKITTKFCEIAGPVGVFLAASVALWNTMIAINLVAVLAFPMKIRNIKLSLYNHALAWTGALASCAVYASPAGVAQRSVDGLCAPDGRNLFTFTLPLSVCLFITVACLAFCWWKLEAGDMVAKMIESSMVFVSAWVWALVYYGLHTDKNLTRLQSDYPWLVLTYVYWMGFTGARIGWVWMGRMGRVVQGRAGGNKGELMIQHSFDSDAGMLRVEVQQARRLPAADNNGLSDPYTLLVILPPAEEEAEVVSRRAVASNRSVPRTKVIKRSLNPVWDETFELELSAADAAAGAKLLLRVYDWDFGSADDALGETIVNDLARAKVLPGWHTLRECGDLEETFVNRMTHTATIGTAAHLGSPFAPGASQRKLAGRRNSALGGRRKSGIGTMPKLAE